MLVKIYVEGNEISGEFPEDQPLSEILEDLLFHFNLGVEMERMEREAVTFPVPL